MCSSKFALEDAGAVYRLLRYSLLLCFDMLQSILLVLLRKPWLRALCCLCCRCWCWGGPRSMTLS
jgi:hypothetical protein